MTYGNDGRMGLTMESKGRRNSVVIMGRPSLYHLPVAVYGAYVR